VDFIGMLVGRSALVVDPLEGCNAAALSRWLDVDAADGRGWTCRFASWLPTDFPSYVHALLVALKPR
jgi:hypothetical protein